MTWQDFPLKGKLISYFNNFFDNLLIYFGILSNRQFNDFRKPLLTDLNTNCSGMTSVIMFQTWHMLLANNVHILMVFYKTIYLHVVQFCCIRNLSVNNNILSKINTIQILWTNISSLLAKMAPECCLDRFKFILISN